ncbi:hypothetical protein [Fulvitalea axinellae]
MKKYLYLMVLATLVFAGSCKDSGEEDILEDDKFLEVVTEVAGDLDGGMTLKGTVVNLGETEIEKVGFAYWVQGNLGTRKEVEAEYNASEKTFTATVTDLKSYTTYAYAAFAEDKISKEEGDILSKKTPVAAGVEKPQAKTGEQSYVSFNWVEVSGDFLSDGNSEQARVLFTLWEEGTVGKERTLDVEPEEGAVTGVFDKLKPGVEYAYVLVAMNELGTAVSDTVLFETKPMAFVDIDATGTGDGSSWENAFTSVKTAMETTPKGIEIWVAEGLYAEKDIPVQRGWDLYGGFNGTEEERSQRDWMKHPTIIGRTKEMAEADQSNRFRIFSNRYERKLDRSTIDGFTFQYANGKGVDGGVLYSNPGSPHFLNCNFKFNKAEKAGGVFQGKNSHAYFFNCVFEGNRAEKYHGGVLRLMSGTEGLIIENCKFIDNYAKSKGGAIYTERQITIKDSEVSGNYANEGGALFLNQYNICPIFLGINTFSNNESGNGKDEIWGRGANGCAP